MALLNGLYVHAKSETIENSYTKTNNPVEEGVDVTDHIERNLIKLRLEGELIDTPTLTAGKMYSQLQLWANKGTVIEFRGRNVFDCVITNISKTSTAEISNGAEVTIDFEEMRIANSLYTEPKANSGTQQVQSTKGTGKEVYHIVEKGEWLLKIAKKYNTTLEWILAHNKLKSGNPNLIYPGEKILVSTSGVPNTSTTSATNKTTNKTKTNTTNTAKQTSKTVAKANSTSNTSETEQSYVVSDNIKTYDPASLVEAQKQKAVLTTYKMPNILTSRIYDRISRMRFYVKYFKDSYSKIKTAFGEYSDYLKYVNGVEYGLNVIEENTKKNRYSDAIGWKIDSYTMGALDKCDKAKLKVEYALSHQTETAVHRKIDEASKYLDKANDLLYEYMNKTDHNK